MITEEVARKQLDTLHREGNALAEEFGAEQRKHPRAAGKRASKENITLVIRKFSMDEKDEEANEKAKEQLQAPPVDKSDFEGRYQTWYSRALSLMKRLAPDRYAEFQSFYVVDPRYPWGDTTAYVIQDYFRGRDADDAGWETLRCFKNQLAILNSVAVRLAWGQLDTDEQAERGLQLALLETARDLIKIDERAAGALAGTVLEGWLKKLAAKHKLKFRKHVPPLREYIGALHAAKVFDIPVHAQAIWLAEINDRCRSPGESLTKLQVRDLIDGTRWLIANIF